MRTNPRKRHGEGAQAGTRAMRAVRASEPVVGLSRHRERFPTAPSDAALQIRFGLIAQIPGRNRTRRRASAAFFPIPRGASVLEGTLA